MHSAGTSIVIAAINVGFSFILGRCATYSVHRNLAKKLFGILAVVSFFGFVDFFNLFVGQFREATELGSWQEATHNAVTQFLVDPIGLRVFDSWILVLLGILFGVIAFWDALTWDDPYPGFGRVWRRYLGAIDSYAYEKESLLDELEQSRDTTLEKIRDAREEIGLRGRSYRQANQFRASLKTGFPLFLDEIDRAANALLSKYREINRANRKTDPPRHFSEAYRFPPPETFEPEERAHGNDLKAVTDKADEILTDRSAALASEYQAAFAEYERIARLVQKLTENGNSLENETTAAS